MSSVWEAVQKMLGFFCDEQPDQENVPVSCLPMRTGHPWEGGGSEVPKDEWDDDEILCERPMKMVKPKEKAT